MPLVCIPLASSQQRQCRPSKGDFPLLFPACVPFCVSGQRERIAVRLYVCPSPGFSPEPREESVLQAAASQKVHARTVVPRLVCPGFHPDSHPLLQPTGGSPSVPSQPEAPMGPDPPLTCHLHLLAGAWTHSQSFCPWYPENWA